MQTPEGDQPPEIYHSIWGEEGVYTTEEFIALLDQEGRRPSPYVRQFFLRIIEWPAQRWRNLRVFIQRGRRGWADRDTWNLDEYLARVKR